MDKGAETGSCQTDRAAQSKWLKNSTDLESIKVA
jgi:hypothetical protein